MAIDTAEKRRAAAAIGYGTVGVTPVVSKDVEWRYEVGWAYPFELAGVEDVFWRGHHTVWRRMKQ